LQIVNMQKRSPSRGSKVGVQQTVRSKTAWLFHSFLCVLGIALCLFAYYVEIQKEINGSYIAMCDISPSISCSKVFNSRYGRGFGLIEYIVGHDSWVNQPNSIFGLAFYGLQIVVELLNSRPLATLQLSTSVLANVGSVYLAAILLFVLYDLCVVCVATYVINFCILLCNVLRWKRLHRSSAVWRVDGVGQDASALNESDRRKRV